MLSRTSRAVPTWTLSTSSAWRCFRLCSKSYSASLTFTCRDTWSVSRTANGCINRLDRVSSSDEPQLMISEMTAILEAFLIFLFLLVWRHVATDNHCDKIDDFLSSQKILFLSTMTDTSGRYSNMGSYRFQKRRFYCRNYISHVRNVEARYRLIRSFYHEKLRIV